MDCGGFLSSAISSLSGFNEIPNVDLPTTWLRTRRPAPTQGPWSSPRGRRRWKRNSRSFRLDTMRSNQRSGANSQITLQFRSTDNIDAAAQDVQSALSAAARQLPPEMPTRRPLC